MFAEFRAILVTILLIALTFVFFALWPQLDRAVAGLGFAPPARFWLEKQPLVMILREVIWNAALAVLGFAAIALIAALIRRKAVIGLPARAWGFVASLYLLAPGLLVNGLLKRNWGRARPADTVDFGGTALFTAPHEISQQCLRNCSFVSGEVAGAMALAITLLLILAYHAPRLRIAQVRLMQGAILLLPLAAGLQRIATGRHFLSDALLSGLFVVLVAQILALWLRPWPATHAQVLRT